jgi:predicted peptidase
MKKNFLLLLLATTLTVTTLSSSSCLKNDPPPEAPTETQTGGEYESDKPYLPEADVNIAKYKLDNMDYWLYTPDTVHRDLPLIVYLHDKSDGSTGIDGMIRKEGPTKAISEGALPINAYVLMPSLSGFGSSWSSARSELKALIAYVCAAKDIDTSKVYLTGAGIGATEVYELALASPNEFAAFAPVGGNIPANADPASLKNVRLLAYVSVDIEDPNAASILDFMFEVGKVNNRAEVFALENYNANTYVKLYADMEYHPLEALLRN